MRLACGPILQNAGATNVSATQGYDAKATSMQQIPGDNNMLTLVKGKSNEAHSVWCVAARFVAQQGALQSSKGHSVSVSNSNSNSLLTTLLLLTD
jgi:hypothetical protein